MAGVIAQRQSTRQLLLVSPSASHHQLARAIFRLSGWRIGFASSARAALSHLRSDPAEIVLSACDLPDCSWREFVRVVHGLPPQPSVVLFSPFADEALWAEVLREGVWDLVSEPFDPDEMRRIVAAAGDARESSPDSVTPVHRALEPLPAFHSRLLPAALREALDSSRFTRFIAGSSEGVIIDCSLGLAAQLDRPIQSIRGRHIREFLTDPDAATLEARIRDGASMPEPAFLLNFVNASQSPFTLDCRLEGGAEGFLLLGETTSTEPDGVLNDLLRMNNELVLAAREMHHESRLRQSAGAETLRETLDELVKSYGHLRAIREIFGVCESCGAMQTEPGKWREAVRYLEDHELLLAEGSCPRCELKYQTEDNAG